MTTDRDREAFEAWLFPQCSERTHPLWIERRGESYAHPVTRGSWEGWQAAIAHAREAVAQEPVAEPAKKLYPAHPRALRASIAELDMWLDSSDTLDEIKNQQSFSESIWLVVHELKRLQAVLAAAPVSPPTDHSEDTLDMVKAPPAESGEVERLREALRVIAEPLGDGARIGDPWSFYADLQAVAREALAPTPPAGEG